MRKLHRKRDLVLYGAAGMGVNLLNLMMGSYLCSALLIGGFGEAAVPFQTYVGRDLIIPAVWAVFALAAKIVDGIIDIPMASFADNLRTRFGRRRPAIVIGLIPMIVSFLLFLVIPHPEGVSLLNTVYYGLVLCVFYSFYTLTMVSYYATFTEIVESESDRNFLSNVKSVCDIFYFIIGYVLVRALLNGLNVRTVALMVLPLTLTMLIPLFLIKEPSMQKGEGETVKSVSLVASLKHTFRNRTFVLWMIVYSFMTFGVQLFLGGINEYFSYVGMSMILVMASSFAPVPFTLILYTKIQKKYGFGVSFRYALITFAVGMLAMFGVSFLPAGTSKTVLSVVTGLVSSFSIGSLFSVAYSVPSLLAAKEEEKTGISNSAMYFAVQGLFAGVATGLATGVVLTALKGSEDAASGNIVYLTAISAAGALAAVLLMSFLPKSLLGWGRENKTN